MEEIKLLNNGEVCKNCSNFYTSVKTGIAAFMCRKEIYRPELWMSDGNIQACEHFKDKKEVSKFSIDSLKELYNENEKYQNMEFSDFIYYCYSGGFLSEENYDVYTRNEKAD